jgi:hypothetical protein
MTRFHPRGWLLIRMDTEYFVIVQEAKNNCVLLRREPQLVANTECYLEALDMFVTVAAVSIRPGGVFRAHYYLIGKVT